MAQLGAQLAGVEVDDGGALSGGERGDDGHRVGAGRVVEVRLAAQDAGEVGALDFLPDRLLELAGPGVAAAAAEECIEQSAGAAGAGKAKET